MKMKKGFTLIELLAVIAILAIIMLIATPRIMDAIEESRISAYNNQIDAYKKAAELYFSNHASDNEEISDYVTIEQLITGGYLGDYLIDPRTSENLKGIIKFKNEQLEFVEVKESNKEVVYIDNNRTINNIIIEGNSEQVTSSTGKNLFDVKAFIDNGQKHGLTESQIEETTYNGKTVLKHAQIAYSENYWDFMKGKFKPNTQYTLSFTGVVDDEINIETKVRICFFYTDGTKKYSSISITEKDYSLISDTEKTIDYIGFAYWSWSGNAYLWDIQLEEGNKKTDYEPFIPDGVLPDYPEEVKSIENSNLVIKTCNLYDINTMPFWYSSNDGNVLSFYELSYDHILAKDKWIPKENTDYTVELEVLENTFNEPVTTRTDTRFYTETFTGSVPASQTGKFYFNLHTRNDFTNVTLGSLWFWTPNTVTGTFKTKVRIYEGNYTSETIDQAKNCNNLIERKVAIPDLRKIGNSTDTYNLLTGEYIRNVDKEIYDGSEVWVQNLSADKIFNDVNVFHIVDAKWINQVALADKYEINEQNSNDEQMRIGSGYLFTYINKGKADNLTDFKAYLSNNNIKLYSELSTPINASLSPYILPEDVKYIYIDGEVKGNIIVEYNE